MQNPTAYVITCVVCGKQMSVPAQFLETLLGQFQCNNIGCKSSKRPDVVAANPSGSPIKKEGD
jgi:hypothetical protein